MMPSINMDWMDEAACRGVDTEIFFPAKGQRSPAAETYCFSCGVRAECMAYDDAVVSSSGGHHYGIYGGVGPAKRKALSLKRKEALRRA